MELNETSIWAWENGIQHGWAMGWWNEKRRRELKEVHGRFFAGLRGETEGVGVGEWIRVAGRL